VSPGTAARPIVWSIAATDGAGGAGLGADQRAVEAFDAHLCPVVAAVGTRHPQGGLRVDAVDPSLLDAQLAALAVELRPRVVKTGRLGSAANVRVVADWIDRLRIDGPVALVVDPVLGGGTGARLDDEPLLAAYRTELLPRATLITPNRREATRLLGDDPAARDVDAIPGLGRALRRFGRAAVAITGGDSPALHGRALDWIDTPQARGWLAAPHIATLHRQGLGCTFAASAAAALALGFVVADALVLAKLSSSHALARGHGAGAAAGPVRPSGAFGTDAASLPLLSWGDTPQYAAPAPAASAPLGLYAVVDSAERAERVLATGVRTLQLRIKTPAVDDAAWRDALREQLRRGLAACRAAGALCVVNDHWELAAALGAPAVHLGQEDVLALGDAGRARLLGSGLQIGISSHSLWELARARALSPRYIACGPVWPTLTKQMPWRPQGLDNLAWWCAMAGHPVVAIGGLLAPSQFEAAARCGADGLCAVRILGEQPERIVPALQQALRTGRRGTQQAAPSLPHPTLEADVA
jgi:hydroxymethylpyrimidine kinase/phosphomethylpyrimidine kinase/thiamine-phosphate diphosphorylase